MSPRKRRRALTAETAMFGVGHAPKTFKETRIDAEAVVGDSFFLSFFLSLSTSYGTSVFFTFFLKLLWLFNVSLVVLAGEVRPASG